eukprot:7881864-Pyramimonas_sp.AAC.1
MLALCWASCVYVVGLVFELRGLPIGGVPPRVGLSALMGAQEFQSGLNPDRFARLAFFRMLNGKFDMLVTLLRR